ncbi:MULTISPECIES: hypothetical protein [Mesorhizobium]|uniref:Class IIb bacteriocin, lactobin A/cerein 7B family n=1 Tax=Mesorhizobium robiniae TaxID=559315 RepID=A0ABV2GZ26_9HYPH|nr:MULTISPECIES: hypothetical protein [Mesorhizobium]MCV3211376.1 hypothetical protein [Mesorhizobium sp. YC-2]MCV3233101.1 hypothetical protein [Mesorhizobium sp. YC-39]MCV3243619.1 hypothetical protein [Mesorhizobium sp. ZC-5]
MKTDMSAYGVNELAPEEASAISGGVFWALAFVVFGVVGLAAVSIAANAVGGRR